MKKLKLGSIYQAILEDHHTGNGDAPGMQLEAFGRLVYEDKKHVVLSHIHQNGAHLDREPINCEEFSIVKKALVQLKRLG